MCKHCEPIIPEAFVHRWEIPLVRIGTVATIGAIILGIGAIGAFDQQTLDDQPWLLSGFMVLLLLPAIYAGRYFMAAQQRANAARVSGDQFPEVWAIYSELLDMFALPAQPKLYIQNGNGVVNAFAFSCSASRNYVVLNAEIAVLAKKDPATVRFVLAHELAHHKLGHVTLRRLAIGIIMDMMYIPGKALSRAQEYSADRLALAMCPETADSLLLLSVGPLLSGQASAEAMARQASEEANSLTIRVVNAMQTHPVFTKRFLAIKRIEQGGFDNHGALF